MASDSSSESSRPASDDPASSGSQSSNSPSSSSSKTSSRDSSGRSGGARRRRTPRVHEEAAFNDPPRRSSSDDESSKSSSKGSSSRKKSSRKKSVRKKSARKKSARKKSARKKSARKASARKKAARKAPADDAEVGREEGVRASRPSRKRASRSGVRSRSSSRSRGDSESDVPARSTDGASEGESKSTSRKGRVRKKRAVSSRSRRSRVRTSDIAHDDMPSREGAPQREEAGALPPSKESSRSGSRTRRGGRSSRDTDRERGQGRQKRSKEGRGRGKRTPDRGSDGRRKRTKGGESRSKDSSSGDGRKSRGRESRRGDGRRPGKRRGDSRRSNDRRRGRDGFDGLAIDIVPRAPSPEDRDIEKVLLVNAQDREEARIALVVGGRLEEIYVESTRERSMAGQIFRGRVQNVEMGIGAAFVDLGRGVTGFLHVSDMPGAPRYTKRSDSTKKTSSSKETRSDEATRGSGEANIADAEPVSSAGEQEPKMLASGDEVVVQVTRDGIGRKGPALTGRISLPGRYLVLLPYAGRSGISRRIPQGRQRQRMRKLLRRLEVPGGMGVIVRTASETTDLAALNADLAHLVVEWDRIKTLAAEPGQPGVLRAESNLAERSVRDIMPGDVTRIVVDRGEAAGQMHRLLRTWYPSAAAAAEEVSKIAVRTVSASAFTPLGELSATGEALATSVAAGQDDDLLEGSIDDSDYDTDDDDTEDDVVDVNEDGEWEEVEGNVVSEWDDSDLVDDDEDEDEDEDEDDDEDDDDDEEGDGDADEEEDENLVDADEDDDEEEDDASDESAPEDDESGSDSEEAPGSSTGSNDAGRSSSEQEVREEPAEVIEDPAARILRLRALAQTMPEVEIHTDPMPLFHAYGIESQLEEAFRRTVRLPSGGSLVFDPTEALVAIDVNSGRLTDAEDPERTALVTNLEAVREVSRQLRLRDRGGLVVIDFIDMRMRSSRRQVETELRDALSKDRARIRLGRMGPFGLVVLSRQRIRQALTRVTHSECGSCHGTGRRRHVSGLGLRILREMQARIARARGRGGLEVRAPHEVLTWLKKHRSGVVRQLRSECTGPVELVADTRLAVDGWAMKGVPPRPGAEEEVPDRADS